MMNAAHDRGNVQPSTIHLYGNAFGRQIVGPDGTKYHTIMA